MIKRRIVRGYFVCLLVAGLAIVVSGCWNPFAPSGGGGGVDPVHEFRVPSSPVNVVHNLTTAYVYSNPQEYLNCMADNFTFFLNPDDLTNDPTLPEYWGKATEDTIAQNMLGDGSPIDRIQLELTQFGSPVPNASNPDNWDYNYSVDLRVHVGLTIYVANTGATYTFQVDPNEVGPAGEQLWEILWWYDVENFRGAAVPRGDGQQVSWSRLKELHRY